MKSNVTTQKNILYLPYEKETLPNLKPNETVPQSELYRLKEFKSNVFDIVGTFRIEPFESEITNQIYRILKPKGILMIQTKNNQDFKKSLLYSGFTDIKFTTIDSECLGHLTCYKPKQEIKSIPLSSKLALSEGKEKEQTNSDKLNGIICFTNNFVSLYDISAHNNTNTKMNWKTISTFKPNKSIFDRPSIVFDGNNKLYRLGGRNEKTDQCLKYCEYLDLSFIGNQEEKMPEWKILNGETNEKRCSGGALFLQQKLYFIGGDTDGDALKTVECYDEDKKKWIYKANMNEARFDFGIANIDNRKCIVMGGYSVAANGISFYSDSVEIYDVKKDKWELSKKKLPKGKRARCGAFYWKNKSNNVVIAGGSDTNRKTVELFNLEKQEYSTMKDLNNCHWWPAIGLKNDNPFVVYVCGVNEKDTIENLEWYDSRDNVQKWHDQKISSPIQDKELENSIQSLVLI